MPDLLLVFPPQWSPFQPALSLPSVSAWLKRAGFDVRSVDLNVLFYEWLLSDECADLLIQQVDETDWRRDVKLAYRTAFSNVHDFRQTIQSLKGFHSNRNGDVADPEEYVRRHYLAVKSLETYLYAVSQVCQQFVISPYEFRLKAGNLEPSELERQIDNPPMLLERFLRKVTLEHIIPADPRILGISCIGQEQLFFTLLLGQMAKEGLEAPILVGGTIFSRIFERGVLIPQWFDRFFDIIVRNEGERPSEQLLSNLASGRPLTENVPSIVYHEGDRVVSSRPCPPLKAKEIPIPDFDDLPLGRYISAEITLPLLSSRGCYWGKCEFCHHGMVYGEKFGGYEIGHVRESVEFLARRHGVRHFAFNDEAIPPKIMRAMGQTFPPNTETGWAFTGLIKFDKFFDHEDFVNLRNVGFRSLYVGLESASERVLALMRKNNKRETVVRNLADATSSDIWMHCFLFFGFPGETEADAQETYDFVLSNPDIISSFGTATFVLEHNAPIFHHVEDFGVKLNLVGKKDVDVYYEFEVSEGITHERALEWMNRLNEAALDIPSYNAAGWVPRELQLCMLTVMTPQKLVELGLDIRSSGGLPGESRLSEAVTVAAHPVNEGCRIIVNRVNGRALAVSGKSATLFDLCYENGLKLGEIRERAPVLFDRLASRQERLTSEAVMSPVPAPL